MLEAMKMQHVVDAPESGFVDSLVTELGALVSEGQPIVFIKPSGDFSAGEKDVRNVDLDEIRPDLAEALTRRAATLDVARPEAVAKRHDKGFSTARENIDAVVDPGSFVEFGGLALAAQRGRHPLDHLRSASPADGIVCGSATINAEHRSRFCIASLFESACSSRFIRARC